MDGGTAVRLVPLEEEHIARYLQLSSDPILVATMGWRPFEPEESERFLSYVCNATIPYIQSGRTIALSIIEAEDNIPIGYLSLKGIHDGRPGAEVGLAIMDGAYRGRGLGTEALRHAAAHAFEELGLSLLALTVFPDNLPAIRSYEKVGFTKTELLMDSWALPDGTLTGMWVMELYRRVGAARCRGRCDAELERDLRTNLRR